MNGKLLPLLLAMAGMVFASPADFTTWTLAEDPPDANLNGSATVSTATLTSGPLAVADTRDVGFQSTSGNTVSGSSGGFYFSHTEDFTVAIDFDLSFSSAVGGLGLGFGIGEEGSGENSAGVGLLSVNGIVTGYAGASRINDVTQTPSPISIGGPSSGTLLVTYTASSGDIQVGYNASKNAGTMTNSTVLSGLQNSWNDQGLLVSFFIRSDDTAGTAWTSGTGTGEFENFRILNGTATMIPEPATFTMMLTAFLTLYLIRRRF